MTGTMNLKIITPERIVLDRPVDRLIAKGTDGEFEILPNHEPLVATLAIDVLRFYTGNEEDSAAVIGGVLEVSDNQVTVLSDVAELDAEIDISRATQAKEKAEAEKTQRAQNIDVYVTEMAMSKALARIRAADIRQRKRRGPHGSGQ